MIKIRSGFTPDAELDALEQVDRLYDNIIEAMERYCIVTTDSDPYYCKLCDMVRELHKCAETAIKATLKGDNNG